MRWIKFLFRWDGRIRGGQLLVLAFAVELFATLLMMALVFTFLDRDPGTGAWRGDETFYLAVAVSHVPAWAAMASLVARRLHDLGLSASWMCAVFAYVGLLCLFEFAWGNSLNNTWLGAALAAPIFVAAIWLVAAPGERGDNRYGSAPIA